MKILVAVKRVIDPYVKIRVNSDQSGVESQNVKMAMNPFDEIALEQAVQLKEQGIVTEIIAVSVGHISAQETLRHALALGACRAILIEDNNQNCSLTIAKILKKIVDNELPQLVLLGKQSIDGDNNQTAQMLSALLDWPQATFISKLTFTNQETIEVVREIDRGLETLALCMPAILSVDLRLNQPRYATLPNIMKAKKKPLDIIALSDLGLSLQQHITVLATKAPPNRSAGVKVSSVVELVDKLRHEAKVL